MPLPLFPRMNGKFTLATQGWGFPRTTTTEERRNFPLCGELERKTRRSHTVVGLPKNKNKHGGGAYKRRLRTRKECELGRAAAEFDILKNRDSRKEGRLGQVTLLSGARTTRLFHLRWSVNNDFPLVSDQIYLTFARPRGFVPGLSPEARREAVKRFPSFRFF